MTVVAGLPNENPVAGEGEGKVAEEVLAGNCFCKLKLLDMIDSVF